MKKIKQLLISITLLSFIGCGVTESENEIDPNLGFDMWEYMTASLDYEVEYALYEDGKEVDYYVETNRMFDNGKTYERRSETGRTTHYLNSNYILMKEPTRDVEISRYVKLGENHIFRASDIDNCKAERFYATYKIYNVVFDNVLMIDCLSQSGVKQELYYGFNEGIVAIYQSNKEHVTEYVKVKEKRLF